MENVNPYETPDTPQKPDRRQRKMSRRRIFSWQFHLVLALLLFPVWFLVGGAIAIGGSSREMAIDGAGWLVCLLYLAFALVGAGRRLASLVGSRSSTRPNTHDNCSE